MPDFFIVIPYILHIIYHFNPFKAYNSAVLCTCTTMTTSYFQNIFVIPNRNPWTLSSHSPHPFLLPPLVVVATDHRLSASGLNGFACSEYFMEMGSICLTCICSGTFCLVPLQEVALTCLDPHTVPRACWLPVLSTRPLLPCAPGEVASHPPRRHLGRRKWLTVTLVHRRAGSQSQAGTKGLGSSLRCLKL